MICAELRSAHIRFKGSTIWLRKVSLDGASRTRLIYVPNIVDIRYPTSRCSWLFYRAAKENLYSLWLMNHLCMPYHAKIMSLVNRLLALESNQASQGYEPQSYTSFFASYISRRQELNLLIQAYETCIVTDDGIAMLYIWRLLSLSRFEIWDLSTPVILYYHTV